MRSLKGGRYLDRTGGYPCFVWPIVVVDGDTIKCNGQLMRLIGDGQPDVSGGDTPELRTYKCKKERTGAWEASRLNELVAVPGATIENTGAIDSSGRPLVRIRLPGGKTAECILEEGYALSWSPNSVNDWCRD
jgi:micrococcal nuclease